MPTKPTENMGWGEGPGANDATEPESGKKTTGWAFEDIPPFQWINWIFRGIGRWLAYLSLGPLRFDRAAQATDQGISTGGFVLQYEVKASTGRGHRLYVGTGTTIDSIYRTVNAYWDAAEGKWTKDTTGEPAYATVANDAQGLRYLKRGENDDAPWTDANWTQVAKLADGSVPEVGAHDVYRNIPACMAYPENAALPGWQWDTGNFWRCNVADKALVVPLAGLMPGATLEEVKASLASTDIAEAAVEVAVYKKSAPFSTGVYGTQLGDTETLPSAPTQEVSVDTESEVVATTDAYVMVLTAKDVGAGSMVNVFYNGTRVKLRTTAPVI